MKNILFTSAAVLALAVFAVAPVQASVMETLIEQNEVVNQQHFEEDCYLSDEINTALYDINDEEDYLALENNIDELSLYDPNDEEDYLALETEENYGEIICVLYDENDEEDYLALETDMDEILLYDENDEEDYLALEANTDELSLYDPNDEQDYYILETDEITLYELYETDYVALN